MMIGSTENKENHPFYVVATQRQRSRQKEKPSGSTKPNGKTGRMKMRGERIDYQID